MIPDPQEGETVTRPTFRRGRWTRLGVLSSFLSLMWGMPAKALNGQVEFWSLVDEMRLSGSDSLPFGRILSVAIGPDRSVFVTGTGDVAVHLLGPDGDYRGTVGREGDGPGEFRTTPSIGIRNDTLWAIDSAQRLVHYFHLAGRIVGARRVPDASSARGLGMMPIALLDGERFLLLESAGSTQVAEAEPEGRFERELALLLAETGGVVDVVALDASTLWLQFELPGGIVAATPQPWSTIDLLAVSPNGDGFVVVRGRGTERRAGRYLLQWFDTDGRTKGARSVEFVAADLRKSEIKSFLDGVSEGFAARSRGDSESVRRTIADALYTPEYLPGVRSDARNWSGGGVLMAADGTTWVAQQDSDGMRWRVFDPMTQELAKVGAPEDLSLRYVGREYVWGVREGEFGTPDLYRYRISRW